MDALELLERDSLAASSRGALEAKLRTLHRALVPWGITPFPPTRAVLRALGATLKRGGYRSAASYLYLYKTESQRRGFAWTDVLQRLMKDAIRSCERGMGPGIVAKPLPLHHLHLLPPGEAPWSTGGRRAPETP